MLRTTRPPQKIKHIHTTKFAHTAQVCAFESLEFFSYCFQRQILLYILSDS